MLKRRSFVVAAVSCLITAAVFAMPSASGATLAGPTYWGFNAYVTAHTICNQKKLGNLPMRRTFVYWDRVEPTQGTYNWVGDSRPMDGPDEQYQAVVKAGLQPLIVVDRAPDWARDDPNRPGLPHEDPNNPELDHMDEWLQFVEAVARRYPAAIGIEIWNEPNLEYSVPDLDPQRYARALQKAYKRIQDVKATDPNLANLKVISGGLGPSDQQGRHFPEYLAAMLATPGTASAMDGIGVHPYPMLNGRWDPAGFGIGLRDVRTVRDKPGVGAAQLPIWVTEAGVSTTNAAGWPLGVSEQRQADYLEAIINDARDEPDVEAMLIHTTDEGPLFWATLFGGGIYYNAGLGVFRSLHPTEEVSEPKPAAYRIAGMFGGTMAPC